MSPAPTPVKTGGRPLLFYSAWPLDYFNPEARRKAEALDRAGYDLTYVAGIGLRNPRLSSAPKMADRIHRKLVARGSVPSAAGVSFKTDVLMVAPPRQPALTRRLNARWIGRQLRGLIPELERALVWVRWPTPELVAALEADRPAAVVYECVDPYEVSPGVRGVWAGIFAEAERRLIELSDVVVTPSEALAARLKETASEVVVIPHGVDVELFSALTDRPVRDGIEIGFAGTLDYRLDVDVLHAVANADPSWHLRLVGPVQEGFDPKALGRFPNVTVEGPVPHERVGAIVAGFDVGILPYVYEAPHYLYEYTDPIKASELLAAGRPIVARRNRALDRLASGIYFADSPEEFVDRLKRALAEDGPERSRARRALIATNGTWEARLRQIVDVAEELAPPAPRSAAYPS